MLFRRAPGIRRELDAFVRLRDAPLRRPTCGFWTETKTEKRPKRPSSAFRRKGTCGPVDAAVFTWENVQRLRLSTGEVPFGPPCKAPPCFSASISVQKTLDCQRKSNRGKAAPSLPSPCRPLAASFLPNRFRYSGKPAAPENPVGPCMVSSEGAARCAVGAANSKGRCSARTPFLPQK